MSLPKWAMLGCVLMFLFLMVAQAGVIPAQLVLYDDFKSSQIAPSKWLGTPADPDMREAVRELVGEEENRRLRLSQRAYSATTDDVGTSGGLFGLAFPAPNKITEVSFTVVVKAAQAVGCASNPPPSGGIVTSQEFRGSFFNVEASPTSSSGDVSAVIGSQRSPTDTSGALTVVGFYGTPSTTLDYRVLGSIQPDTANTFHIKWDRANHQFIFQLNNGPEVVSPYTVSDSTLPFFPVKSIDVARVVPHCTTTPRPFTSVDAFFGNVYVNATAVP